MRSNKPVAAGDRPATREEIQETIDLIKKHVEVGPIYRFADMPGLCQRLLKEIGRNDTSIFRDDGYNPPVLIERSQWPEINAPYPDEDDLLVSFGKVPGEDPDLWPVTRMSSIRALLAMLERALDEELPGKEWADHPPSTSPAKRRPRTDNRLGAYTRFPADRINKGTIEAYARVCDWQAVDGFFRGVTVASGTKFRQTIGFRTDPGQTLWDFLRTRGEAAIKAHYALWARCYETTGGEAGKYIVLDIPQFCEDLGYTKHHKGGFRREHKQEAVRILHALTTAELSVEFTAGSNGKVRRLRGPLWQRGIEADERDQYGDLFGAARMGDPSNWEPVKVSYAPGQWFEDPEWRKHNKYVGLIGAGILRLDNRNDRWAIRIGGFYGTLARFEQYRPRAFHVLTVLRKTGLSSLNTRNPQEQEEAFRRAHDRLVEVGVLKAWVYDGEPIPEPDMDDPDDLAALADYQPDDWRRRRVVITWPDAMTAETARLEAAEQRAVARSKQRGKSRSHSGKEGALSE